MLFVCEIAVYIGFILVGIFAFSVLSAVPTKSLFESQETVA